MVQINLFTKQSYRCRKQTYNYQGERREGENEDIYMHHYIYIYKIDT